MMQGSLEKARIIVLADVPKAVAEAAAAPNAGPPQIFPPVIIPDRAPYPTRMRVLLILSLLSLMMQVLVVAWAIRSW